PFDIQLPSVDQQYQRICNLELRVTGALESTYTDDVGEFSVRGEAYLYQGIIPNYGDVFIADVGDGRAGLFCVVSAKPMTYYQATVYQIQYSLMGYVDEPLRR